MLAFPAACCGNAHATVFAGRIPLLRWLKSLDEYVTRYFYCLSRGNVLAIQVQIPLLGAIPS
jgi:hypothetical protein